MKLLLFCLLVALSRAEDMNLLELAKDLGATDLEGYIKTAGLEATFTGTDEYTVFAPTNEAFAALDADTKSKLSDATILANVLKYHVVSGKVLSSALTNDALVDTLQPGKIRTNVYTVGSDKVVTVTGSKVTQADKMATNGVVHVIDKVMLAPDKTVAAYVTDDTDFSTLLELVQTASLAETLAGDGPFTVFAPNNAAFAKIPAQNLTDLKADVDKLKEVLLNHVVNGTYYSPALSDKQEFTSLGGNTIKVDKSGANVKFNEGKLVTADVLVTNGVIHVIDTVLLEDVDPEPSPSGASAYSAVGALVSLTGILTILLMRN